MHYNDNRIYWYVMLSLLVVSYGTRLTGQLASDLYEALINVVLYATGVGIARLDILKSLERQRKFLKGDRE